MVSGFLVRHDGALVSIDDIIYITAETFHPTDIPPQWHIIIYMREGYKIRWNKSNLTEDGVRVLLHELKNLIKKAIEL